MCGITDPDIIHATGLIMEAKHLRKEAEGYESRNEFLTSAKMNRIWADALEDRAKTILKG